MPDTWIHGQIKQVQVESPAIWEALEQRRFRFSVQLLQNHLDQLQTDDAPRWASNRPFFGGGVRVGCVGEGVCHPGRFLSIPSSVRSSRHPIMSRSRCSQVHELITVLKCLQGGEQPLVLRSLRRRVSRRTARPLRAGNRGATPFARGGFGTPLLALERKFISLLFPPRFIVSGHFGFLFSMHLFSLSLSSSAAVWGWDGVGVLTEALQDAGWVPTGILLRWFSMRWHHMKFCCGHHQKEIMSKTCFRILKANNPHFDCISLVSG